MTAVGKVPVREEEHPVVLIREVLVMRDYHSSTLLRHFYQSDG